MVSRDEIDELVKKVQGGVDNFESFWYKVFNIDRAMDLKDEFHKQGSKLRQRRNQINKCLKSTEFKDVEVEKFMSEIDNFEAGIKHRSLEGKMGQPRSTPLEDTFASCKDAVKELKLSLSRLDFKELSLEKVHGIKDTAKQRQTYLFAVKNFVPSFPPSPELAKEYIRGYKVLRKLGEGDNGLVFEVMDPTTSETFALKVIQLRNGEI